MTMKVLNIISTIAVFASLAVHVFAKANYPLLSRTTSQHVNKRNGLRQNQKQQSSQHIHYKRVLSGKKASQYVIYCDNSSSSTGNTGTGKSGQNRRLSHADICAQLKADMDGGFENPGSDGTDDIVSAPSSMPNVISTVSSPNHAPSYDGSTLAPEMGDALAPTLSPTGGTLQNDDGDGGANDDGDGGANDDNGANDDGHDGDDRGTDDKTQIGDDDVHPPSNDDLNLVPWENIDDLAPPSNDDPNIETRLGDIGLGAIPIDSAHQYTLNGGNDDDRI